MINKELEFCELIQVWSIFCSSVCLTLEFRFTSMAAGLDSPETDRN